MKYKNGIIVFFAYDDTKILPIFLIVLSVAFACLIVFVKDEIIMVLLCFLMALTSVFGSVMVLLAGIHCNLERRTITIVDYFWVRRVKLNEIKFVTFKEIEKKRKKCLIPLFSEAPTARWFYEPNNVYNNGAVFVVEFHLKNGTIEKSNYTWLFQAKSMIRVERQKEKLKKFVSVLNENINTVN